MKKLFIAFALMLLCSTAWGDNTTVTAQSAGFLSASSKTYVGARDTTESSSAPASSYMALGQRLLGDTFQVMRSTARFVIPAMSSAEACTLWVWGKTNESDTDFQVYVVGANSMRSVYEKADYTRFDGRVAGGAHTSTILNDAYSTLTDYTNGAWNQIIFNAAGLDSLAAAQGDTLYIAIISKEDTDNSAPIGDEYIVFSGIADVGEETYLSFTYNDPVVPIPKHTSYTFP